MTSLRIATCRPLPEPDVDEDLLLEALANAGIDARMAPWNDPAEEWAAPVPTVIRSTWDYLHDPEGFLGWAARASSAAPLWNPMPVLRWNLHKRYLVELAEAGLPVVPTALVERGGPFSIARVFPGATVVVKPAVSAGSFATKRFAPREAAAAQAFVDDLVLQRDVLVQPYVASVDGYGERSLVVIEGQITHSIRKAPRFDGQDESVSEALPIDAGEADLAQRVLAACAARTGEAAPPLYARVDLARDEAGAPMLMELEVIEPSLFLRQSPRALTALVEALGRRLAERA